MTGFNGYRIGPDRSTLDTFVGALFRYADDGTFISLRAFDDSRAKGSPPILIDPVPVGDTRTADWIFNRAKQVAQDARPGCFCPPVCTFTGRDKAAEGDIANGLTLCVECDANPAASRRKLAALLGEPTIVSASGGEWTNPQTGEIEPKLHLHWRLSEATRDAAGHAQLKEARRLACHYVGADASAVPLNHPLRWPGSVHRKGEPKLARIVAQTENEVELADALDKLRAACPDAPRREAPQGGVGAGLGLGPDLSGDLLDITAALSVIPNADLPWDEWNRIAMAAWGASAGGAFPAFDAWSRRSPKYDAGVTAERWDHIGRHPPANIGAGSLYFLAQQAAPGWRKPSSLARDARHRQTSEGDAAPEGDAAARRGADGPNPDQPRAERGERPTLSYQGMLVPAIRDRLDVALAPDPAPPFPVGSLPPLMRDMVAALIEHVQAPESLCAHAAISAAALVCQGLADISVPSLSRPLPLSLFMLAIAASGERKSTCDGLALKAVSEMEARMRETYAAELRDYRAERGAYEGEVSRIKADKKITRAERAEQIHQLIEPTEPTIPTLRAEEPNLEGLMNLLARGKPSIGLFTAEGGSFLGGHGMSDDAKVRTITGLSRLYDDGSGQRIRAKEVTFIHSRRVSVSLAVQPQIAARLLGDETAKDQGFVGRFLVCMPDSTIGKREVRVSAPNDDPRVAAFKQRAGRLLALQEHAEGELKLDAMTLDPLAWEVWRNIAQAIENDLGEGGMWRPVRATAQRMPENIARLAGVLHLFCHGHLDQPVTGETMAVACEVGGFYLKEALRLTGSVVADGETQVADALARWLTSRPGDLISPTLIQRKAPNHLRADAKRTRGMVQALCAAGVLEAIGSAEIDGTPYREVYRLQRGGRH